MKRQREYDLERQLWETLSAIQDYLVSGLVDKPDQVINTRKKLALLVQHWREHPNEYLQHPAWKRSIDGRSTP